MWFLFVSWFFLVSACVSASADSDDVNSKYPNGYPMHVDFKEQNKELRCPYEWGTFSHPEDCAKYIICIYNVPTVYSCTGSDLFHAKYRRCISKEMVNCDDRISHEQTRKSAKSPMFYLRMRFAPYDLLISLKKDLKKPECDDNKEIHPTVITPRTTQELTSATPPITYPPTTTAVPTTRAVPTTTTAPTTRAVPTTTAAPPTIATKLPTTIAVPMTTFIPRVTKPNTPPPTDCDEDDLDCIIDTTGDVKGWFDCPGRYGHFVHGSSRQLFIHCDNFRPFVKKCADHTVFSPKDLVCKWIGKPGDFSQQ